MICFFLANVYAPCDVRGKRELWNQLGSFSRSRAKSNLCVCGDFNSVCLEEERRSRGMVVRGVDTDFFNSFIADSHLMDFSLGGRHFTWFSGDGLSMSPLDSFLLSEELSSRWYNCAQIALQRGLSDHCPHYSQFR